MTAIKRLLYWLIAGSEGGLNRARIMVALRDSPLNSNQLTERVGLNYKTVRHHLDVLERNELVVAVGRKYGRMFFISPLLEREWAEFEAILAEIGHNDLRATLSGGE
jgi:DNA-binding transcriptional ArsR family regulator